MGRVKDQSLAAPPVRHFTHPHDLHPLPFHNPQTLCSGCKLQSSGTMYTCTPCAFTLHQSCATLPRLITHPSHVGCTLSLLAVSSYPGGIFSCNACTKRSDSWNYHCATCEYDLHVSCASKPIKIRHPSHGSCELELTFKNPYGDSAGFSCDVCRKTGSKQWLYRCISCEFDVHLDCSAPIRQPVLQHQHSAPPVATLYHNQSTQGQFPVVAPNLMHSASTGAIQNLSGANQGRINAGQPYGSLGGMQNNQASGLGGNMMAAALQGFVEGAFQGVGQAVVQEVIGDGGGGGGGNGGDGGGDGGGGDVYSY